MKIQPLFPLLLSSLRIFAVPSALAAVVVVRNVKDHLELDSSNNSPLLVEDGTIRTKVFVLNPGRHPVLIERIEMSVSDSLGTFTLRCETPPANVPPGYSLAVELVATNFRPLRLSRRCIFRARFFNHSGCLCTFAQPFTNLWPAEYFEDTSEHIPLASITFLQRRPPETQPAIDRRHNGADLPPA